MKTINYLLLVFSLMLLSLSMNAAQEPEEAKHLFIVNETSDKIEIGFRVSANKETITLDPGDNFKVQLMPLEELIIAPYGKLKGWVNKEVLTAGHLRADNHANHPHIIMAQETNKDCCLAIRPGGTSGTDILSLLYNTVASKILPYQLVPFDEFKKQTKLLHGPIFTRFPQVAKAYDAGDTIFPRYFLRVAEHASKEEVHAAYTRAEAAWRTMMISSSKRSKRELASTILRVLNEACKNMLNHENEYDFQLYSLGLTKDRLFQAAFGGPVHLSASESDTSTEDTY